MAHITLSFDEFGGIAEFNGLSTQRATALIINKAADFLDNFRFFNAGIDNFTDFSHVRLNWEPRTVVFPILLE